MSDIVLVQYYGLVVSAIVANVATAATDDATVARLNLRPTAYVCLACQTQRSTHAMPCLYTCFLICEYTRCACATRRLQLCPAWLTRPTYRSVI